MEVLWCCSISCIKSHAGLLALLCILFVIWGIFGVWEWSQWLRLAISCTMVVLKRLWLSSRSYLGSESDPSKLGRAADRGCSRLHPLWKTPTEGAIVWERCMDAVLGVHLLTEKHIPLCYLVADFLSGAWGVWEWSQWLRLAISCTLVVLRSL